MNKQLMRMTSGDLLTGPIFKSGVGFDRLFGDLLETSSNFASSGYPPYNLTRVVKSENDTQGDIYEITMAVAGFKMDEIDITVSDRVLTVEGKQCNQIKDTLDSEVEYLHKGIAERDFTRNFKLANNVEVKTATMRDGLLIITLIGVVPESAKPKKIKIR
jgi:molecular chaperone IbpA